MNSIQLDKVRNAAIELAKSSESKRNTFLQYLARDIHRSAKKILSANERDVHEAKKKGLQDSFIQRLVLDQKGIRAIVNKLADVQKLQSGIGETIEQRKDERGLILKRVRVPLGVLLVIYEARPEVTVDVAALCVKSGNAAILKGGTEALRTNAALYECIVRAMRKSGLPSESVLFIETGDRKVTNELLLRHEYIDLVIARGSYGMVRSILDLSTIPVLAHASGGARIYIDKSADQKSALKIIVNAKITKPAACNTMDTVLIDRHIAAEFVPKAVKALSENGVEIVGDEYVQKFAKVKKARTFDWDTEFLGMKASMKVVDDVYDAVKFTNRHSKRHTEGIVSRDKKAVEYFLNSIDAAALFVNASTRLHDGFEFGLGSEMGIATGKLHARGPVGLKELTTYKWVVFGNGTLREK